MLLNVRASIACAALTIFIPAGAAAAATPDVAAGVPVAPQAITVRDVCFIVKTPTLPGARKEDPASTCAAADPAQQSARFADEWNSEEAAANLLLIDRRRDERLGPLWIQRQLEQNGLLGTPVGFDRLYGAIQSLNMAFLRNGYTNSGLRLATPGLTATGTLRLELVWGGVVSQGNGSCGVQFEGRGPTEPPVPGTVAEAARHRGGLRAAYFCDRLPSARAVPLDARRLERDFRLLASDPAVGKLSADLKAGSSPGEALLDLRVVPAPRIELNASFANSRSPSIGGERAAIGGALRNVLLSGSLFQAELGETSGRIDYALSWDAPLARSTILSLRGGQNDAAVVDPQLRALDIRSRDWTFEGGLARRLIDTPLAPGGEASEPAAPAFRAARRLEVGIRYAERETISYLLGEPFSFSPGSVRGVARYRALRLVTTYTERAENRVVALSLTGTLGIGGTRGDAPGAIQPNTDFRSIAGQFVVARRINRRQLEFRGRVAGQYADGALYAGERLAVGGVDSVRGYRETLLLADTGLIGSLELVQPFRLTGERPPDQFDWGRFAVGAFIDGAIAGNRRPPAPDPGVIGSVGAQLSWTPSPALLARITLARGLAEVRPAGERDLQDRGVSFLVTLYPLRLLRPAT